MRAPIVTLVSGLTCVSTGSSGAFRPASASRQTMAPGGGRGVALARIIEGRTLEGRASCEALGARREAHGLVRRTSRERATSGRGGVIAFPLARLGPGGGRRRTPRRGRRDGAVLKGQALGTRGVSAAVSRGATLSLAPPPTLAGAVPPPIPGVITGA